jgi:hypothetical protein
MTRRFFSLFFFFVILASFSVFGATLLDEDFSYTDVYTNHGWQLVSSCGLFSTSPTNISIFDPATNLGFGEDFNTTDGCSYQHTPNLRRDLGNYTQRTITLTYEFYHNATPDDAASNPMIIRLSQARAVTTPAIEIRHLNYANDNHTFVTGTGITGFIDCDVSESHLGNHDYELQVDFLAGVYSFYMDGILRCANISAGSLSGYNWQGFNIFQSYTDDADGDNIRWIDDIVFINSSEGLAPASSENATGEWCNKNDDCASGFCDAGLCGLAPFGFDCTSDSDCLSGDCSNGKCTNPSLSNSIQYFISHFFGGDSATKNIIALFLILLITFVIGYYLKSFGLAVLGFYALSVLMLLLGLLSVFLFFVFIIAGIVIAFVTIFVNSKN